MKRIIDSYLEKLVDDDKLLFYQTVSDFAEENIMPNWLDWERNNQLIPDSAKSETV